MDAADQESFHDFVAARWGSLLRLAILLTGGDRHEAEDLVQAALLKAFGRWRHIEEPEAYVRKAMYRHQVSRWRLLRPQREITVAVPPEGAPTADGAPAADLRLTVRTALARLTPRQRTVLVLRYLEDHTETEVAALLGCSVGTVRSTTHRSLARLRALAPELTAAEPQETAAIAPLWGTDPREARS
ncbi:SigE family RNA polymerase sigma factor [Streptomyces sp. A7024]|uniref:SigE family RNA polymerase sigma factor n=1 Tax=Streptomyces coryli TaxID=1128680 RepID=A0A6G4U3C2_9ACTN|nr:SigE family RNA polymerase sigma factor [Streptomyces coryli]NGN66664.1 SigE family RNA polymerase sigma factor [Streptomyces coryli]